MRVHDPFREPGRPRRVVDLGGVVGRRVERLEAVRGLLDSPAERLDDEDVLQIRRSARMRSIRSRLAASVTITFAEQSRSRCTIASSP